MRTWHCPEIVTQAVGDELLLLDQRVGQLHRLNATAAWIYGRCDGRTSDAIAAELATHFDVAGETAQRDVEAVMRQLAELGVVRIDVET